ncbi:MAG: hypothetical protein L0228_16520 [Planctomycetes bacterium]|nr:hypothetical protein [Planctomycetota bacterium]
MSALSKRRSISYYLSLPIVVAIVFLLVAKLVAMQRADIIAELTDRVAHRETEDAAAAVRELGDMSHPPASVLVAAATASDRKVAGEAKQAILKWLGRSRRQIEAGRSVKAVARQLAELAEALATQRDAFSAADQPWLVNTTQRILRLANQLPPKHTPLVATHCDLILASVPATVVAQTDAASGDGAAARESNGVNQAMIHSEHVGGSKSQQESSVVTGATQASTPAADSEHQDSPTDDSFDASWRSEWSRPVFRMIPTTRDAMPTDSHPSPSVPSSLTPKQLPVEVERIDRPLAEVESRVLLRQWLAATGADVFPLEEELSQRGFVRPVKLIVQKFFSNRATDRLQLVDEVVTAPSVDARPWLMLLAEDVDADVRLAAVTIMATSNDAALVEKAWHTAIRDRDPRIAGLAGRLRERRAATQRR